MDKRKESIFRALGEASMCWSEIPAGIFNDKRAIEIANKLYKDLFDNETQDEERDVYTTKDK